jgi:23S rRNA-intervening sequence protein
MSEADTKRGVKSFEDLEVFRRAYRLSLEVHKLTLGFPSIEQQGLADQSAASFEIDLRQSGGGVCQAASIGGGVQTVSGDGNCIRRRDAGVDSLRL